MIVLKMECNQCRLRYIGGKKTITAGCKEYIQMTFKLCQDWQALYEVVATFRGGGGSPYTVPVVDGACQVPPEVLVEPSFSVGLMGTDPDGVRIVSTVVYFSVSYGEAEPGEVSTPTPTIYELMLQLVEESAIPRGGSVGQLIRKAETGTEWCDANDHEHSAEDITVGALPISHGGTGATTRKDGVQNLAYIGVNPVGSGSDTPSAWNELGCCIAFYDASGTITDKPTDYGIVLSVVAENEVHQIWMQQTTGALYHRGGNSSGWSGSWKEVQNAEGLIYLLPLSVENGGTGVTTEGEIALKAYPVGALYMSVSSTSPQDLFGGTWEAVSGYEFNVWKRTA